MWCRDWWFGLPQKFTGKTWTQTGTERTVPCGEEGGGGGGGALKILENFVHDCNVKPWPNGTSNSNKIFNLDGVGYRLATHLAQAGLKLIKFKFSPNSSQVFHCLPTSANPSQVVLLLLGGCAVFLRAGSTWRYRLATRRCKFWFCNLTRVDFEFGLPFCQGFTVINDITQLRSQRQATPHYRVTSRRIFIPRTEMFYKPFPTPTRHELPIPVANACQPIMCSFSRVCCARAKNDVSGLEMYPLLAQDGLRMIPKAEYADCILPVNEPRSKESS